MVRVIASSVVYRGFKPKTLWLAFAASPLSMQHYGVHKRDNMSIRGLLFQWASTIKIKLRVLDLYKADLIIIIPLNINLFLPWYRWKIAKVALTNNHSLTSLIQYRFVITIF